MKIVAVFAMNWQMKGTGDNMAQEERIAALRLKRGQIRQQIKPLQEELDQINAELSQLVNDDAADKEIAKMSPGMIEALKRRMADATT